MAVERDTLPSDVADRVREAERRADRIPKTLVQLRNYFGLTDVELAARVGMTRQTLANKLKGVTPVTIRELGAFSAVFGVPVGLFFAGGRDCIQWIIDHTPDDSEQVDTWNLCSTAA